MSKDKENWYWRVSDSDLIDHRAVDQNNESCAGFIAYKVLNTK